MILTLETKAELIAELRDHLNLTEQNKWDVLGLIEGLRVNAFFTTGEFNGALVDILGDGRTISNRLSSSIAAKTRSRI